MAEVWRFDDLTELMPSGNQVGDVAPSSRCASCSACCLSMPGAFYPADLGTTAEERRIKARELLASGRYAIDWYEEDEPIYYLRPSTCGMRGVIFDPSWGGPCTFLGEAGCSLDRADRPTVCKSLVPTEKSCQGLSKADVAIAWAKEGDSAWLYALGVEMDEGG